MDGDNAVKEFAFVEVWKRNREASFRLRSPKEHEELSSSEMKRDGKVKRVYIKVSIMDVVEESEFDVLLGCRFLIFVYTQNLASFC